MTAVNVHAINHMRQSLGYTVAQASFYIMLMTASQLAGVLIGALAEVVLGLGTPSLDSREETRDPRESRRDR